MFGISHAICIPCVESIHTSVINLYNYLIWEISYIKQSSIKLHAWVGIHHSHYGDMIYGQRPPSGVMIYGQRPPGGNNTEHMINGSCITFSRYNILVYTPNNQPPSLESCTHKPHIVLALFNVNSIMRDTISLRTCGFVYNTYWIFHAHP